MRGYDMKSIHVTMTNESMSLMLNAAEYAEIPLSIWARITLIEAARSSAHKKLCATIKEEKPMWAGKPCTKEEYEKWSKDAEAYQARLRAGA